MQMVVDHLMALIGCTYLNFEFKHKTVLCFLLFNCQIDLYLLQFCEFGRFFLFRLTKTKLNMSWVYSRPGGGGGGGGGGG